jgi:hypothetical protein
MIELPASLDWVGEEVSTGALLKEARGDRLALMLDFADRTGNPIIVYVKKKALEGKLVEAKDFKVRELKEDELKEWLVLNKGLDRSLI